jgi:hypothetical protein
MTSQMTSQASLPDPAAAPGAADPRRCKQPGCDTQLPAAAGRGAPRLFCGPACSRKWHNDHRSAAGQPAEPVVPPDGGPLAGLHDLLTRAAGLTGAAAAQLAAADPARVTAAQAAADAARRQAEAQTAVALAEAAQAAQAAQAAAAAVQAARDDARAALEAADQARADADAAEARARAIQGHAGTQIAEIRAHADAAIADAAGQARATRADRDAALAAAESARHHAGTQISRARQAEADARAENDHVRADAARERDAATAACAAQLAALQALADTHRARADYAEQQLGLERDHQRRLTTQPHAPATSTSNGSTGERAPATPAAKTTTPAARASTAGRRP